MTELDTRLRTLIEAAERARHVTPSDYEDRVEKLPADKRAAWASFLCSIATTESIETMILEPIRKAFEGNADVMTYLDSHGEDEQRHHGMLTDYVKLTFNHEKTHRSLSDRVIYGAILPRVSAVAHRRPLVLLAALRFYEAFSLDFYKVLKRLAERDRLPQLLQLIAAIEKDELRHLAGLEVLVKKHIELKGPPGPADLVAVRGLLQLLLFDINIAPWAVHNRRVRRNALAIGIDPRQMGDDARAAAEDSLRFVRRA